MPEPAVTFSLLDAARVVARGGSLDDKLAALAAHARTIVEADAVVVLLHDMETGTLLSLDALTVLGPADQAGLITGVLTDRVPAAGSEVPGALSGALPGARSCLVTPLVVEDEDGASVEGLLVVGWSAGEPPSAEILIRCWPSPT